MFRALVIYFDKKNKTKILTEYSSELLSLQKEMARYNIDLQWDFVEEISKYENDLDSNLYITDSAEIFEGLKNKGNYVIALTHRYNRDTVYKNASYLIEGLEGLDYKYLNRVYQRFVGLPWDILETKNLKVRESTVEDVDEFYRIYKEPSITYYMDDLFKEPDMERAYIRNYTRYAYEFYGFGLWTVLLKESGQVIGRAGLSVRDGYELPELGFVIDVAYQGKGYAKEVCQAILFYAWEELELERVQALVHASNAASLALLKKLGFSYCKEIEENEKNYQLWIVRKQ